MYMYSVAIYTCTCMCHTCVGSAAHQLQWETHILEHWHFVIDHLLIMPRWTLPVVLTVFGHTNA